MKGTVKWFNTTKGYGFIETAEGDFFLHFSEIQMEGFKKLVAGDEVEFDKKHSEKGWMATNVRKIQWSSMAAGG